MSDKPSVQSEDPNRAWLEAHLGQILDDSPSPLGRWLAGRLMAVHDDGVTMTFVVRPEMANPAQVLHGGIAAAMMDELIGATLYALSGGRYHASVNLSVDYLAPARVGDTVTARTRILRKGRRVVNATCTLANDAGELLAHATSNLLAAGGESK